MRGIAGIRGAFVIGGVRTPNIITDEGEETFIKMITQAQESIVAADGNFYIGLCTDIGVAEDATLSTLSGELLVQNGYARKAVTRNASGWPTVSQVNGVWRARTATVNFAASGGNFSAAYTRAFLCNASAGSSGKLLAIGGRLADPVQINDGQDVDVAYELYLGYA